ncbi:MAG: hypothetical protein A2X48_18490 [Lentisphaerae bacterium GWF2_49_21]|nr:MAG: hypothetical protein A2X48_18490 [Lentisphaerae bacterium GWF2_49_21]
MTSAFTIALSFLLAFYLRFEFQFPVNEIAYLDTALPLVVVVKLLVFYFFGVYSGMWRYVSIYDLTQILLANIVSSLLLFVIIIFSREHYLQGFSRSVLILDFMICFFAVSGKRVLSRIIREAAAKGMKREFIRTLILGSSGSANNIIQTFSTGWGNRDIIGIIDNDMNPGISIRGVPVLGEIEETGRFAKKYNISEILLLPPYSSPSFIREIMDQLEKEDSNCVLRMVPTYADIASGKINVSHLKNVEIEDLLGRKPVNLDRTDVAKFINGKRIMVTGAGGSIGSELCRQITAYKPECLVLFELSEFNLYDISRKLRNAHPELKIVSIIGDVRSKDNVSKAMSENKVEIVYHAAAYKHVPLMEENPTMAFETNVLGSSIVIETCEKYNVKRLVLISTDKAICPTSVMGSTKRLAERLCLERQKNSTEFTVVRFGNVLDSSGSVIPLFKQQIKEGGPVTVTSKNVVRYFMSIPEAVDLVLQAGTIGNDRDIMVLEMGEPVKIYDMARKLIELSGLVPDKDIEIKITGLRPGEKEYEELLTDEEKVQRTPFDRIYVARKQELPLQPVDLDLIRKLVGDNNVPALKELLAKYIPENKFNEAA